MKPKLDWMNVLEQALGTILATAVLAAIGYLYNLSTGKSSSSHLLWYIPVLLGFMILLAVIWRKFRKLITSVGQFVVKNWQLVLLFFITLFALAAVLFYTKNIVLSLSALILVIITFFLTRSRFTTPALRTFKTANETPIATKRASARVTSSFSTRSSNTAIVGPNIAMSVMDMRNVYQELDLPPKEYEKTLESAKELLRQILGADLTTTQRRILMALIEKTDSSPIARRVIESATGFSYLSSEFYEEVSVLAHYDLADIREDELSLIYFPHLAAWTFIKALCNRSGLTIEAFLRDPRIELIS